VNSDRQPAAGSGAASSQTADAWVNGDVVEHPEGADDQPAQDQAADRDLHPRGRRLAVDLVRLSGQVRRGGGGRRQRRGHDECAQRPEQGRARPRRDSMRQVEDDEQDRRAAADRDRHRGSARQQRGEHELHQHQVGDADPGQGGQPAPAGHQEQQPREQRRDHPERGVADEVVKLVLAAPVVGSSGPRASRTRSPTRKLVLLGPRDTVRPVSGPLPSTTDAVPHTAAPLFTALLPGEAPAGPAGDPALAVQDCWETPTTVPRSNTVRPSP